MSEDTTLPLPSVNSGDRRIGAYRVLRELSRGGMGVVYLAARADDTYQKRVAIKVIQGCVATEDGLRQFRRERQILAALNHPNIATLLDGGMTEEGLPYLVMEFVEGEPIDQYCDSHHLNVTERLRLFRLVCAAVQYAHRNLVVHRDLKPGNILVTADGAPKLLDFGIAKLINPELLGESPRTVTQIAMTPEYASPEQARGFPITTSTDVYSLGVVLYQLLTGRLPYRFKSRQVLDVLVAVSEQEPELPSTAARKAVATQGATPEMLSRRLKGDLDNILLMALRKEQQSRYVSVDAFSEDLRRYLEGLPVKAHGGGAAYRSAKWIGRHKLVFAAVVCIVVLIIGFAASMAVQSARLARERNKAQKVSDFLVELFRVSDPSETRGNTITAREVLDRGAERIAGELKDQPDVRATLLDTMGTVYNNLGLYDRGRTLLEDSLRIRRRLEGESVELASTLHQLGNVLYTKGEYAAAEPMYREALAMRRKLIGNVHVEVSKTLSNLASVHMMLGNLRAAEPFLREALAIRKELYGDRNFEVSRNMAGLADLLRRMGDYAAAEPLFREALTIQRATSNAENRDSTFTMSNLAATLVARGKLQEAGELSRESQDVTLKVFGKEHPLTAQSMRAHAWVLKYQGDLSQAETLLRQALAIERRTVGEESSRVAWTTGDLADVLHLKGDRGNAERLHRQALGLREKVLGPESPENAHSLTGLSAVLTETGRCKEAEPLARRAVELRRKALGAAHPETAWAESVLGAVLTAQGRFEEAEPLLLASHKALEASCGAQSTETRLARRRLLDLYKAWNKPEKGMNPTKRSAAETPNGR